MPYEVHVRRPDGWHLVSTPADRPAALADAAAEQQRDGRRSSVRVMADDGSGTRVQLGVWGRTSVPAAVPDATGPTPTLR